MSCLTVDLWLRRVPPAPGFELILEMWAAGKGEKIPLPIGPAS